MKVKNILFSTSLSLILAAGGYASLAISKPDLSQTEATEAVSENTVYRFANNLNWDVVYVYAYGEDELKNEPWPGVLLSDY